MKKLIIFATAIAIALLMAKFDYLELLYVGILLIFGWEYCSYCVYEVNTSIKEYEKNREVSRKMVVMHAALCVFTIIFAAICGFLGGYDKLVELGAGSNPSYETVHVEGFDWALLVMLWVIRVLVQVLIERAINENIELTKRRQLYNA